MTKYICDRCGDEMSKKPEAVEVPNQVVANSKQQVELCADCLIDLNEFLRPLPKAIQS